MINAEQVKQFVVGTIIPPVAGLVVTWLAGTKVLAILGVSPDQASTEITRGVTFAVSTAITFFVNHKILSGNYAPAAKEAAAKKRS